MNKASKFFAFLSFFFLFSLSACKTSKVIDGELQLKKKTNKFLHKKIVDQPIDFEWLSLKARVGYKDEYQGISAIANIRVRKDSAIWMNVKKFNIEAARVLITPDSVFLIDRINRQYARTNFSYLEKIFRFPKVYSEETKQMESLASFESLQEMIYGNVLILPEVESTDASIENPLYKLTGAIDKDFSTKHWLKGNSYSLAKMNYMDQLNRQSLDIELDDYRSTTGPQKFSYFRNINMKSAELGNVAIEVKITDAEFNVPKSMIFEIPSRYKKIE